VKLVRKSGIEACDQAALKAAASLTNVKNPPPITPPQDTIDVQYYIDCEEESLSFTGCQMEMGGIRCKNGKYEHIISIPSTRKADGIYQYRHLRLEEVGPPLYQYDQTYDEYTIDCNKNKYTLDDSTVYINKHRQKTKTNELHKVKAIEPNSEQASICLANQLWHSGMWPSTSKRFQHHIDLPELTRPKPHY
jgi:hypothetical protein